MIKIRDLPHLADGAWLESGKSLFACYGVKILIWKNILYILA